MVFIKYSLVMLLFAVITACGSVTEKSMSAADSRPSEKQPNPYWQKQPPIDEDTERAFEQALYALQANDLEAAQQGFEKLTLSHPDLSGPWVNLGIVFYQRADHESAEKVLLQALKKNNLNADAYAYLGLLYREQGRFDDAERAYEQALKKWPDNAEIHCNLGILYDLYTGQQTRALQEYLICEQLMDQPSRQLRGWIVDLERRTQALVIN